MTERTIALVRGAVGLGLVVCSAWLLALPEPLPKVFAVAALVFAALWIVRAIGVLRAPPSAGPVEFLELSHEGIAVRERGQELRLGWREIVRVAIDQDRLTLALLRQTGEIVHIEPRYRGVTLEDLCTAASALHSSAQTSGAPQDSGG